MRFLHIGASGRTSELVVKETLSRGHNFIARVLKIMSLEPRKGLIIVEGTPLKTADVERALSTSSPTVQGAAIITLNSFREGDGPFAKHISPWRLMADASDVVVAVLKSRFPLKWSKPALSLPIRKHVI